MLKMAGDTACLLGKGAIAWSKLDASSAIRWAAMGMLAGVMMIGIVHQESVPRLVEAAATTAVAAKSAPPSITRGPYFAREVALLALCRKELSEGNSARALDVLDRYAREFPLGELSAQALLLRVDVLRSRGDNRRAVALANQFIANNPKSPHAASMKKLIGEARPR